MSCNHWLNMKGKWVEACEVVTLSDMSERECRLLVRAVEQLWDSYSWQLLGTIITAVITEVITGNYLIIITDHYYPSLCGWQLSKRFSEFRLIVTASQISLQTHSIPLWHLLTPIPFPFIFIAKAHLQFSRTLIDEIQVRAWWLWNFDDCPADDRGR